MTHVGYLVAGWGIAAATFVAYGMSLVLRGRRLAAQVPEERRRWMTTDASDD